MGGKLIGNRYRVLRKIGEGGMAVVHLAVDEKLGRDVAIKILRERYENHDEIRTRFQHEARAISSFDHVNILKIYDYSGEESRQLWIVTELIHGRNLAQILETTPSGWLHPVIASSIVREICRALSSAHEHGVVHRDVKPENVMITHHGTVKLMDFGIAKIQRLTNMTQTGIFMGSPSYMSPEQVRGRDVDNRSDIYSLGVLFYELVTGKLPFTGSSTADIAMRILNGDFAHPKFVMAGIPDALDACIVECMALLPEIRPQSIEGVGEKIDKLLGSMGLSSSIAELERCFKDPKAYGDRLAKILKVSEVKQEATVILNQQQKNPVAQWNNQAINSPIPRPDIVSPKHQISAQRRDHLLPPRAIPHFTKRQLTPELIAAHLPERRHQQRPLEATRVASGSKFGQYNVKNHIQPMRNALQQVPQPRPEPPKQKIASTPQKNYNQRPREFRSVSRMVPSAPKRNYRQVRYVVKESYYQEKHSGIFSKFVLAALVLSAIIFFILNKKQISSQLPAWIPLAENQQKAPSRNQKSNTKTNAKNSKRQNTVQASKTTSRQVGSIVASKPLPKFAEKLQATNQNQSQNQAQENKFTASSDNSYSKKDNLRIRKSDQIIQNSRTTKESTAASNESINANIPPKSTVKVTTADPKSIVRPQAKEDILPPPITTHTKDPTQEENYSTNSPPKSVQIAVTSTPAAELFVNGRRQGTTNNNGSSSDWIEVRPGKNRIELRRTGFSSMIETLIVTNSQRQKFGPYLLRRGDPSTSVYSKSQLTLATNLPPVDVTITNIETASKQTMSLTKTSKTILLERGIYEITMTKGGESRRRRVDFSGRPQKLTFRGDFKESNDQ
jgi:serine/threonine protein kinase